MKSGTSCFNSTLFKKNLTRYWPVWALYAIVWMYAMPVRCITFVSGNLSWTGETPIKRVQSFANEIPNLLEGFGIFMAFAFGVLAAMAMFSYLYNNRAASMVHALPVRREGLFLTNYLSGLVCLIGPNALVWLLTLGAESLCSGYMDLYTVSVWFAAQSAMCMFFYSFAVFCAMFTGHLLALPAFYGILNFLAIFLMTLFDVLFEPFLYGYAGMTNTAEEVVWWLTPSIQMGEHVRWSNPNGLGYRLDGVAELVIYTVVGLVLAGLALLVYRKRHIESAGDVVAVAVVRPVFKYGVALCSGLFFGYWLYALFGFEVPLGLMGSLLLWTFIGYFAAEMLLKKSFRVWKAWRGCAVLLVLVAAGLACLQGDAFGFVTRVPAVNKVDRIVVDGMGSYPYDEGRSFEFETQDAALIEKTIVLHKAIVDAHRNPESEIGNSEYIRLNVTYTLSNGTTLRRQYGAHVRLGSALEQAARDFYCDPQVAQLSYGMDEIDPTRLVNVEIANLWNTKSKTNEYYDLSGNIPVMKHQTALLAIYDALMADFNAGNLGKRYLFDLEDARQLNTCTTDLTIYWNEDYRVETGGVASSVVRIERVEGMTSYYHATHSKSITLTPKAENTIRVLTELGVLDGDTTLRRYRDIVDEEERVKVIYGSMGHDPKELTSITLNPNSADVGIIGGADGPTSVVVATPDN